ncbi:MAG: hypothetical protein WCP28_07235 [Actinomycetes bacterium]
MTDDLKLLFIHGQNGESDSPKFVSSLNNVLTGMGYPTLNLGQPGMDSKRSLLIAPTYTDVLKASREFEPPIPRTPVPEGKVRSQARVEYERHLGQTELHLRRFAEGPGRGLVSPIPRTAMDGGVWLMAQAPFRGVKRYVTNTDARRAVLRHLLSQIGSESNLVIVAHSLGTIVATGILPRLPEGTKVPLLVTIGSPLRINPVKDVSDLRENFPYHMVKLWVNLYDPRDPATLGRGLSASYPAALDVRVNTGKKHGADVYLSRPAAGELIGRAFFGELSETEKLSNVPQRGVSDYRDFESYRHALLRFVWLQELIDSDTEKPKRQQSITRARDYLQQLFIDKQPVESVGPRPFPTRWARDQITGRFGVSELLMQLILLYADDPVPPFDFTSISGDHRQSAIVATLRQVTTDAQLVSMTALIAAPAGSKAEAVGRTVVDAWHHAGSIGGTSRVAKVRAPGDAVLAVLGGDIQDAVPESEQGATFVLSSMTDLAAGGAVGALLTVLVMIHTAESSASAEDAKAAADAIRAQLVAAALELPPQLFRGALRVLMAHALAEKAVSEPEAGALAHSLVREMLPAARLQRDKRKELSWDYRRFSPIKGEFSLNPSPQVDQAKDRVEAVQKAISWLHKHVRQ